MAEVGQTADRAQKTATQAAQSAANIVPQGGLFWDGRADTLQIQASGPLLDPREMDGGSIEIIAEKLRHAPYAGKFAALFGERHFQEREFAGCRGDVRGRPLSDRGAELPPLYQQVRLLAGRQGAPQRQPKCAAIACSTIRKKPIAPAAIIRSPRAMVSHRCFTDTQYEALAAPRNLALADTKDPNYFDLGVCGPIRKDIADQTQFCGMFKTPTLRNTAVRRAFFHNGVFQTLQQVMDFYNFRDTNPEKVYPLGADGKAQKYNDIPVQYHANVDVSDPPFNRHPGETPAMTTQDEADIIAFLKTLNDGYMPGE